MDPSLVPIARQVSPARAVAVAGGLVLVGAVAGAAAGSLGAFLWIAATAGLGEALDPSIWFMAGVIGAPFGAVLLPLAGFTALRRVPLGRLLLSTVTGTALGAAIGATLNPAAWLAGAVAGFTLATGWLWYRFRRVG